MYNNIQNDILHQNIILEDLKVYNNIQNDILHQNIILEDLKVYNNIQNDKTKLSYTQTKTAKT